MAIGRSTSSNAIAVYLVDANGSVAEVSGLYTLQPAGFRRVTTSEIFGMPTPPAGVRRVVIQAEGQPLRWRDDGGDPTAAVGMLIPAGGELRYDGADISALRMIASAAGGVANISYYA